MVSDRRSQFVAGLTKELNQILEIETKLSTVFHLHVRVIRSGLGSFLIFFLFSILFFKLYYFSLFLAPRVRVMTTQVTWHREDSRKMTSYHMQIL